MPSPQVVPNAVTSDRPPRPKRHWLISVRMVLVLFLIGGVVSGWQAWRWQRRFRAIRQIEEMRGWIQYQHNPLPVWLKSRLDPEFADSLASVSSVDFMCATVDDRELAEALRELPELESLQLYGTSMGEESLASVRQLTWLESLNLGETGFTDSQLQSLTCLARLKSLILHGTAITDAGLSCLTSLPGLEKLYLQQTAVSGAGLESLHSLEYLTEIHLSRSRVTDADLVHLQKLPRLTRLYLDDTPISDAGLKTLEALSALRYVNLNFTLTTGDGIRALRQARPDLTMEHQGRYSPHFSKALAVPKVETGGR